MTTLNASAVRRRLLAVLLLFAVLFGAQAQDAADEDAADFDDFGDFGDLDSLDGSDESESPDESDSSDSGSQIDDEFESLFETDDMFEEVDEDYDPFAEPEDDPLVSELIFWSGRFLGSLGGAWNWADPWNEGLLDPDLGPLTTTVGADLRFDARPARDYRVLGSFQIRADAAAADGAAVPGGIALGENDASQLEDQLVDENGDPLLPGGVPDGADGADEDAPAGGSPALELSVFELFADFNWGERAFFRFGKHTISWGVGFLFSPADVLNLTSIDPQNPDGDIEGPVSLRTRVPFGQNSATVYLVVPDGGEVLDIAVAPQLLLELGETEFGIAGWYQRRRPPRGILTLRRGLGEFDIFAEGVLAWGSERTFLEARGSEDDPPFRTFEKDSGIFPSATAGFRRIDDIEGLGSLLFAGQYLYNGEGYASNELSGRDETLLQIASAILIQQTTAAGLAGAGPGTLPPGTEPDDFITLVSPDDPTLAFDDIAPLTTGRHYAALTFGLSDLAGSRFGANLFGVVNLTDFSGLVTPGFSYRFTDRLNLSANTALNFGRSGTEFGNPTTRIPSDGLVGGDLVFPDAGPIISLNISLSLGGGSF